MSDFTDFLVKVDDLVWGIPLIVLILAAGIYLTFRLRLLQIVHLPKALKYMFKNEEEGHGEVSSSVTNCKKSFCILSSHSKECCYQHPK